MAKQTKITSVSVSLKTLADARKLSRELHKGNLSATFEWAMNKAIASYAKKVKAA